MGRNALNIESAAVFARYLEVPVSAFSKRLAQQIKEISRSNASNLGEATQPVEAFRYPVITWVAAGAAETAESLPTDDSGTYQTSEYDSTGPAFWLQVRGDSMASPSGMSINEGTSILVDTAIEAAPGRLVVAKFPDSNETTFRMLVSDGGKLYLKPLNQDYPVESFGESGRIIGVVVQAMQKFH
ncbi:S24 family peptidase [Pseudomonas batumici]|uniref:LexA family protein n=1 Tax=Pseudomonas batumici TaxID=226910 RepID=UPI0030CA6C48